MERPLRNGRCTFAGAVVRELADDFRIIDDSTLSAKLLYKHVRENMLRTVKQATHFKRLQRLELKMISNFV